MLIGGKSFVFVFTLNWVIVLRASFFIADAKTDIAEQRLVEPKNFLLLQPNTVCSN